MEDVNKQYISDLMFYGRAIIHQKGSGDIICVSPVSEEGLGLFDKLSKLIEAEQEVNRLFNFYDSTSTPPICND